MRNRCSALWLMAMVIVPIVSAPAWADATIALWAPTGFDPGGGTGFDILVPITIGAADGVETMDLVFTYDTAVLEPRRALRAALTDAFGMAADFTTPGVVTISLTGSAPLTGGGQVASVLFHVVGGPGGSSPLHWTSVLLNGGALAVQAQDGLVPVVTAPSIVSCPDDTVAAGGTQVVVPIAADPAAGALAFDLRVEFNPLVLAAVGVQKTTRTQAMTLTTNIGTPGVVLISLFGTQPLTGGSGAVAQVTFNVVGATGTATPLNLTRGTINDVASVLDDGVAGVCDGTDADGDSFTGCAGDCDNLDPDVHPGAVEVCNGRDDDCNGAVDDGIAPPADVPVVMVQETPEGEEISWTASTPGATFDVVRGGLLALVAGHGDFAAATDACLAAGSSGTTVTDPFQPAPGDGSWHLVRAVNCGGAGTYDSGGPSQQGSRDAGINQSPGACP